MSTEELRLARERMIEEQIIRRGITEARLLAAMRKVPRHRFVPADELAWAYADGPLPIGEGQTISQPYIVALMTDLLQVKPTAHVLEIGTGSGYQAAILAELAASVHTVEIVPGLAERAKKILEELGYTNLFRHLGDGSLGWLDGSPYDGILVAAGAPEVPAPLMEQLAEGGRLVAPIGGRGVQVLQIWERKAGQLTCHRNIAVAFVPLRGEHGWK